MLKIQKQTSAEYLFVPFLITVHPVVQVEWPPPRTLGMGRIAQSKCTRYITPPYHRRWFKLWGKIRSLWTWSCPHAMKSTWRKAEPQVGVNGALIYVHLDPARPDACKLWNFQLWVNKLILLKPVWVGFEEREEHQDWSRLVTLVRLTSVIGHRQVTW